MRSLLSKMWADDKGAVVAPEVVLVVALTVIGAIPGLVALRNAENASLADLGNALLAIQTNFSFAGFAIVSSPGGATVAQVGGASFTAANTTFFASAEVTGNNVSVGPVD